MASLADDRIVGAWQVLSAGGVVCFPTESSYGLAASIKSPQAIAKVRALKERNEVFGLVASSHDQVRGLAQVWPPAAQRLAAAYWPGRLTLVVSARAGLPDEVVRDGTVAVRIPGHDIARQIAERSPLTATSANPHGAPPANSVGQARAYFGTDIDFYLDDGETGGGLPSTYVAVVDGEIRVLRQGAIQIEI